MVKILKFKTYRDKDGKPICAKDFRTGAICTFLGTKSFGTVHVCLYPKAIDDRLFYDHHDGSGHIRPGPNCPLHPPLTHED